MTFGVVTFPGSNCDRDCIHAVRDILGFNLHPIFHKEREVGKCDAVILPGGFSYGDYLRAGAIAKLSPIMDDIRRFAAGGGPVIGICNGFQILCESGLLPGALVRNVKLRFLSRPVALRVENSRTAFTQDYQPGQIVTMPIAHGEGCYVANPRTLEELEGEGRVAFRYVPFGPGDSTDGNPNGSLHAIAGIVNESGNVLGMMPHPERACDPVVTSMEGAGVFLSVARALAARDSGKPIATKSFQTSSESVGAA
jgi:phosphoribosylformylglycinamidine synthase I